MRLFTAVWPSDDAVAALAAAVDVAAEPGWRRTEPEQWHLTLAFHGDADPRRLARALDRGRGLPAPRLRTVAAGAFPGVRWAGVQAAPLFALTQLVTLAGGDADRFVPHLTLLRRTGRRGPDPDVALPLPTPGPWWAPRELRLVASTRAADGPRYTVVHRVPLG